MLLSTHSKYLRVRSHWTPSLQLSFIDFSHNLLSTWAENGHSPQPRQDTQEINRKVPYCLHFIDVVLAACPIFWFSIKSLLKFLTFVWSADAEIEGFQLIKAYWFPFKIEINLIRRWKLTSGHFYFFHFLVEMWTARPPSEKFESCRVWLEIEWKIHWLPRHWANRIIVL